MRILYYLTFILPGKMNQFSFTEMTCSEELNSIYHLLD